MASQEPLYHLAHFFNDDDEFIAYSTAERDYMPVYTVHEGYHVRTASMHFPSCLKFMPYATGDEPEQVTKAEILKRYGEQRPLKGPWDRIGAYGIP